MQRLILAGSSLATNQCCAKIPWTEFCNRIPWWSQVIDATLYLKRRDGVLIDGTKLSSRFQCGREVGALGSLAARGVVAIDWTGVWQGVIVNLFPTGAARRYPSSAQASLAAGVDTIGTRGDITRHRGAAVDPVDGQVAEPVALDGKP